MKRWHAVEKAGQSVWLDFISRELIESGELKRLVAEEGLRGMTSNPAIFAKSMGEGTAYDEALLALLKQKDRGPKDLFDELALQDIRAAADILRPVYDESKGIDGYVSLEVSPYLARDTEGTIAEARRLWAMVKRDNLMIKVPATPEGIPAIETLLADGININVTLLFDRARYAQVAEAYLRGLERRLEAGKPIDRIASVASFFVSRIDTAADKLIEARLKAVSTPEEKLVFEGLLGQVAIANAKLAYRHFQSLCETDRWRRLQAQGAHPQRLLWASTSTKNPRYRDVIYVEGLIGPHTVNTVPPATFKAFQDHGEARVTLTEDLSAAERALRELETQGISLKAITEKLLAEAITLFSDPFDELLAVLARKRRLFLHEALDRHEARLPLALAAKVGENLEDWRKKGTLRRLWAHDASVWTGKDEAKWLGWLDVVPGQLGKLTTTEATVKQVLPADFCHVAVLGMGGSSLGVEVLGAVFDPPNHCPEILALDSTDPDAVRAFEAKLDLGRTLFVVSSKSGSTLEPNLFLEYFQSQVASVLGSSEVGSRFVAITDPGSSLEKLARNRKFAAVFEGVPSIGGRYSVLSPFGTVPAMMAGVDVRRLLESAMHMQLSCGPDVPPEENPGVVLGAYLGTMALQGRDKVTLLCDPDIASLADWVEQLLAESTGKDGKGLIPVVHEPLGDPAAYGQDRQFIRIKMAGTESPELDSQVTQLVAADQPVIVLELQGPYALGQEFLRWEMATAVAAHLMKLNPFDQPDVEASKVATRDLVSKFEASGKLPEEAPVWSGDGVRLFAEERHWAKLQSAVSQSPSLAEILKASLGHLHPGDYVALLAFLDQSLENEERLHRLRQLVRDRTRAATAVGFGPRYLHSTGQAYKGGPNSGVFFTLTAMPTRDLEIPGHSATFGTVERAQALGDFKVLMQRGRRGLRLHFDEGAAQGLETLARAMREALQG